MNAPSAPPSSHATLRWQPLTTVESEEYGSMEVVIPPQPALPVVDTPSAEGLEGGPGWNVVDDEDSTPTLAPPARAAGQRPSFIPASSAGGR
jgi:hypothetical protein